MFKIKIMKVISKQPVVLCHDREGKLEEYLQIEITIEKKDDVNKVYQIKTVDSVVFNKGTSEESTTVFKNRYGQDQIKFYSKPYADYDADREILNSLYPTTLTGSEKDDYLLQMALLQNLINDPIYDVEFEAR